MRAASGILAILVVSAAAISEVGDLTAVAVGPDTALRQPALHAGTQDFYQARANSGTVSKQAVIATFKSSGPGGQTVKAAVDATSPDSEAPDALRIDFTGQGNFKGKPVVPLSGKARRGSFQAQVGPATIDVKRGRRTIPVTVSGQYYKTSGYRYLMLHFGAALEGKCAFGESIHTVRIVDGDNNLRFGDRGAATLRNRGSSIRPGDTLVIDGGEKGSGGPVNKYYYGQPVMIDGKWYKVKLSADKTKISATEVEIETAKLKIPHDKWRVELAGAKGLMALSGSAEPVAIPAGAYKVLEFTQWAKAEGKDRPASLTCGGGNAQSGKAKSLKAQPDQTIHLAVGAPLKASVKPTVRRREVSMSFELTDAAGMKLDNLVLGGGKKPANPQVEVYDAEGKTVHTGKFEYG